MSFSKVARGCEVMSVLNIPCRLCRSKEKRNLLTVDGYPIVKCGSCGFIFLDANFTTKELDEFYRPEYFKESVDYFDEPSRTYMAGGLLDEIECFKQSGKLLEIGCAGGFFLKLAKSRGFDVHGIEISKSASKFAKKLGLDVQNATVENVKVRQKYDVIVLSNVLEHLIDPRRALEKINSWLEDDGIVFVGVPNFGSAVVRLQYYLNVFRYYNKHSLFSKVHLSYFTPDTLKKLCEDSGFKVMSFKSNLFAYTLYNVSRFLHADRKAMQAIVPKSLNTRRSLIGNVWRCIKANDKTEYGIDIQVVLEKRKATPQIVRKELA
jgi:2-polyprenyl-3-methyl-5-hydroxy-6-metoxy-1,4-benzoquinol methylase